MNLKKIAASIAALGAVTFAHAANVEFYGSIDNSVSYIKANPNFERDFQKASFNCPND